jgi:hypothetical protein
LHPEGEGPEGALDAAQGGVAGRVGTRLLHTIPNARIQRRFVGGLIETQREFVTELDALDWVGERLGMDIPARREA